MKRRRSKYAKTRREIHKLLSNPNVKFKMELGVLYTKILVADK